MKLSLPNLMSCLFVMLLSFVSVPTSFAAQQTGDGGFLSDVDDFFRTITLAEERAELNREHGIKISPYYSQGVMMTDNVFNAPSGGKDTFEMIWDFKPGVRVTHTGDYGNAGINYNATIKLYNHYGLQNEQDQFFTTWLNYNVSEDTYFKASETLNQQSGVGAAEFLKPTNWLDNTLVLIGGHRLNEDTELSLGYRMFDRDFSTTPAKHFNYNEDIYSLTAQHNLSSYSDSLDGFTGTASLRLGNVEYSKSTNRDAFWMEVPVGISGYLPMDIKLDATVGIYGRNQEQPDRNDTHWVTTNISLSHVFNKRTKVTGSFRRFPQEATYGGAAISDNKTWALDVKHIQSKRMRLRGNLSISNMDIEQSAFTGGRVLVNGFLIFVPANRVKRNDEVFGLNLGTDYKLSDTVTLHADYNLKRRDSNVSALDMTENSAILRASVAV